MAIYSTKLEKKSYKSNQFRARVVPDKGSQTHIHTRKKLDKRDQKQPKTNENPIQNAIGNATNFSPKSEVEMKTDRASGESLFDTKSFV